MFNYFFGKLYGEELIDILSNISSELSKKDPWYITFIYNIGLPIIIALLSTLITIYFTNKKERENAKKKEYISCLKLFKDIDKGISYLKLEIESNITFLTFLNKYSIELKELYQARKMIESTSAEDRSTATNIFTRYHNILNQHNEYLKTISIMQNSITNYENEYSILLYDISNLLTTKEIDAIIKYYNNIALFTDIKKEITSPGTHPEEVKKYLLDIQLLYEGNQYSIINDTNLISAYNTLYKGSRLDEVDSFKKLEFTKIIN